MRVVRLALPEPLAAQQEDCKIPFNGSGVYSAPSLPGSFNPAISGQQATPTDWNTLLTDLSTALSTTITSDGQSTVTANIPFAGFKLTNVGNATVSTDAVNAGQLQNNATYAADTGAADAYVIAPAPPITAYQVGQTFQFKPTHVNATTTPTLAVSGLTAGTIVNADGSPLAVGALLVGTVFDVFVSAVNTGTPTFQMQVATTTYVPSLLRGYLGGLTLSTAGSSATFGISAGIAQNSTHVSLMQLASAYTKTTSAWTLGSAGGSLDTGSIATTTWYSVFLIQRVDTGVVDVLTSLSATAPTLPTNYTLFRRIGSMKTDGSSHWVAFIQDGNSFQLSVPVADISSTNPGTSAVTTTLASVPTGVRIQASMQAVLSNTGTGGVAYAYLSDLATTDTAPSGTFADTPDAQATAGAVSSAGSRLAIWTNTSAQIRSRLSFSDGTVILTINTLGWIDTRGRDS